QRYRWEGVHRYEVPAPYHKGHKEEHWYETNYYVKYDAGLLGIVDVLELVETLLDSVRLELALLEY
ncbi:hypothetical protein TrCOL_g11693, partial [Triparma columacea]